MLFEKPVLSNMRLRMHPRPVTVDKMAGIFIKRVWQPKLPPSDSSHTIWLHFVKI